MSENKQPLVSCLMVTRDRAQLAQRALHCLANQTWENLELIIIDDGDEDYEPVLSAYRDRIDIHYHRIESRPGEVFLGGLRNLSLDHARGEFCCQWDDDEWYHPERISTQMQPVMEGSADGSVLRYTLMHLDAPQLVESPYRGYVRKATPGTLLHRSSEVRYPNTPRAEDTVYLQDQREALDIVTLEETSSHLFIRCFHGDNTWDERHFTKKLRKTLPDALHFWLSRYILRDLRRHPAFKLSPIEQQTTQRFLAESRELGVLKSV